MTCLFQVDPRPFQTAIDQAEARLALAESQLSQAKAQVTASQAQVEQALAKVVQDEAQVKRAEATQRQTELDVARYTPLAQRGSVSQQELDNAVQSNLANLATVAASRAAVQNSQASVSQSRAALEKSIADVKTQEASIAAARAALAEARLNLGYTRVLVAHQRRGADSAARTSGTSWAPTIPTPLTTVSQSDPIYAEFPISEQRALAVLRRWDADPSAPRSIELELILADGSPYPSKGRAAALDRQVDVTTGTVLARGVFPNPGSVLRPGQYAKVRAVDVRKGALLIPQRAVQDVQGVHQVAVVRPDETVDLRTVKLDERVGSLWVVKEGLKSGERVVVEGGDRVRAGQKVRVEASRRRPSRRFEIGSRPWPSSSSIAPSSRWSSPSSW